MDVDATADCGNEPSWNEALFGPEDASEEEQNTLTKEAVNLEAAKKAATKTKKAHRVKNRKAATKGSSKELRRELGQAHRQHSALIKEAEVLKQNSVGEALMVKTVEAAIARKMKLIHDLHKKLYTK